MTSYSDQLLSRIGDFCFAALIKVVSVFDYCLLQKYMRAYVERMRHAYVVSTSGVMTQRLLLTETRRIRLRDDELWRREKQKNALYNFQKIPCPCTVHKGLGLAFNVDEVKRHLLLYGLSPECRTSRGPQDPDSSDEEWKNDFNGQFEGSSSEATERDNGLAMRTMMQHMYQQVESFVETKEQLNDITLVAPVDIVDNITGINEPYKLGGDGGSNG